MFKKSLIFFILVSSYARAELVISNVEVKPLTKNNYVIYFSALNTGEEVEYIKAATIGQDSRVFKICKTIFTSGVAKIIEIDRLVVPPKTEIFSSSIRVFVPIRDFSGKIKSNDVRFISSK